MNSKAVDKTQKQLTAHQTSNNKGIDTTDQDVDDNYTLETFDDIYSRLFVITQNKSASYRQACYLTGYDYNKKLLPQIAFKFHQRVVKSGTLEKSFKDILFNDKIGARNTINELREYSESENIQLQAAKLQIADTYSENASSPGIEVHVNRDNVQIKAGKDTLTIDNNG